MEPVAEEPKKRGRRKKIIDNILETSPQLSTTATTTNPTTAQITTTTTVIDGKNAKKKTKGAKIIASLAPEPPKPIRPVNIVLHLKCSLREIDTYIHSNHWKMDIMTYDPEIPTDIISYDRGIYQNQKTFGEYDGSVMEPVETAVTVESTAPPPVVSYICSKCQKANTAICFEADDKLKLKQLKIQLYRNEIEKKSDCFWCTYPFDNEPCYILQYGSNGDINGRGSFCSPECAVASLFSKETNLDDSARTESYQLMNNYYGKPNNYNQNIKPAHSPYYMLEKYYGTMTIQEYRRMCKSQHLLLVVEKPVTRVLPEIHEDNDNVFINGASNTGVSGGNASYRGNYKVKRQSEKTAVSRNSILRDQFGIASSGVS